MIQETQARCVCVESYHETLVGTLVFGFISVSEASKPSNKSNLKQRPNGLQVQKLRQIAEIMLVSVCGTVPTDFYSRLNGAWLLVLPLRLLGPA